MKQILLVAQREFIAHVRNKTFLIMTLLTPIIIVAIGGIVAFMFSANSEQKNIAVVDESGLFYTALKSNENQLFTFYSNKDIKPIKDTLSNSKTINALLIIPKTDSSFSSIEKSTELITNGSTGVGLSKSLEKKLNEQLESLKLKNAGISEDVLKSTASNISLKIFSIDDSEDGSVNLKKEDGEEIKIFVAIGLAYIIFMFIMMYGVKVMRSVVEEKNNRVVEIIISSVKPFNLMMGKILGTTFAALTQFTIWIVMTLVLLFISSSILGTKLNASNALNNPESQKLLTENPDIMLKANNIIESLLAMNHPLIIGGFLAFFILGYLFYSSIFAAIGSAVDNDTDTQQFTFYPVFPMIIGMYGSMTAIENPDGPVAFWLSMFPLTSPISMVTRLPFGVEWWEIVLSLTLLIISTIGMIFIASKIYRVGILMYGKKASFKEIWKWIRYAN